MWGFDDQKRKSLWVAPGQAGEDDPARRLYDALHAIYGQEDPVPEPADQSSYLITVADLVEDGRENTAVRVQTSGSIPGNVFLAAHPVDERGVHLTPDEAAQVRNAIDAVLAKVPQEPTAAPESDTPLLDALKVEIEQVGREEGFEYDPGFPKVLAVPSQAALDALNTAAGRELILATFPDGPRC